MSLWPEASDPSISNYSWEHSGKIIRSQRKLDSFLPPFPLFQELVLAFVDVDRNLTPGRRYPRKVGIKKLGAYRQHVQTSNTTILTATAERFLLSYRFIG